MQATGIRSSVSYYANVSAPSILLPLVKIREKREKKIGGGGGRGRGRGKIHNRSMQETPNLEVNISTSCSSQVEVCLIELHQMHVGNSSVFIDHAHW